ncbi:VWA domain-containing protein [Nocardia sp. NPDC058058]|uniref:VWA domain-containing protein n=1 Tax=Nocardia sp. NPDC058058 TaxID=3346317 RepID=UPI0036DC610F
MDCGFTAIGTIRHGGAGGLWHSIIRATQRSARNHEQDFRYQRWAQLNSATSLRKGENATLSMGSVICDVTSSGLSVDVSALLIGSGGKVRNDSDLVFYNHPSQDGVSVSGTTVTADLPTVPRDVDKVVIAVSADPLQPGAVFTSAPQLRISQTPSSTMRFEAPGFSGGETLVVLAELYRRGEGWKVRAVGQGYSTGLAGLAADFGVTIDDDESPSATVPFNGSPATSSEVSAIDLTKVERRAPALLAPAREASRALTDVGLAGRRAAVYLVLDHGVGMREFYESFAVQAFAERVLALSANLDDDGIVPVIFSGEREPFLEELSLENYRGRIGELHTQIDWGWGNVAYAMRQAVSHYQESGSREPAFIIAQVHGDPNDKAEIRALMQNSATLGVFWLFVGFGPGKLAFYKNLNASASAKFTNAAFFNVGNNPGAVPGEKFYAGLVDAFGTWMRP